MHILHLSDLHFGTVQDASNWHGQLAEDLIQELGCSRLDALVLSGDIANRATAEEYAAAERFLKQLSGEFELSPEQIVIVPGNHDVSWSIAKKAYTLRRREEYKGPFDEDHHPDRSYAIDRGEFIEVQNRVKYQQRFRPFSEFYQRVKGVVYPLEYDQQGIIYRFPAQNLLILGLNSAWQLDHHYTARASINANALTSALETIRHNPAYAGSLKFAIWHHPLNSADEDRITDTGFLERLAQAGFCLVMHGHIHKADCGLYRYDASPAGRRLEIVGAGTFGAPTRQLVAAYPWQYQLLRLDHDKVTVETRCRTEPNGAWRPDARWTQGSGKDPLPRYEVILLERGPDGPLTKQRRRVDVSAPSSTTLGSHIDLLVQVRLPDATPLGADDWPEKRRPERAETVSESIELRFPTDPHTGYSRSRRLQITVISPDFRIEGPREQVLEVPPEGPSRIAKFLLTALKLGNCPINVQVRSLDKADLGTVAVETTVELGPTRPELRVVSLVVFVAMQTEQATDRGANSVTRSPTRQRVNAMPTETEHLRRQIAEVEEHLRLIEERKDQYVLRTDVPLDLERAEMVKRKRLKELREHLEKLTSETVSPRAAPPYGQPPAKRAGSNWPDSFTARLHALPKWVWPAVQAAIALGAIAVVAIVVLTQGALLGSRPVLPTAAPASRPSGATVAPSATPTALPIANAFVTIEGKVYDQPNANAIDFEAQGGSTIRIGIRFEDDAGKPVPASGASYTWVFNPPDPANAGRVGTLNSVLNYTVPTDRRGQLISITVHAGKYSKTIPIRLVIK